MSASIPPGRLCLIGCGNMAGAMLHRWLECGLDPGNVTVVRPSGELPAPGIRTLTSPPQGETADILLLGVKPQKLDEVAPSLAPLAAPDTIVVSILAGSEQASLRARFPAAGTIVRAMPNTPVRLGKGVVDLFSDSRDAAARDRITALMAPLGLVEWFGDEASFALAGQLSGAGPAFLFRFIDALAAAGAELGLDPDQAARLAAAMAEGAAALAAVGSASPVELARRVASPGGTTQAGLNVLDDQDAMRRLMLATLGASRRRGEQMAAAARGS